MENPFELIIRKLENIEKALDKSLSVNIGPSESQPALEKPVSGKELCEFIGISQPTLIRYRNKGVIPFISAGRAYRYDIKAVKEALSKNQNGGEL